MTLKKKTKKVPAPSGRTKRGQKGVTPQADWSGKT